MVRVSTGVMSTQFKGSILCLHIGTVAIYFGRRFARGARVELFTPLHRFRWSAGRH